MNDGLPEGWATVELRRCVDVLDSRRVPVNSDERAHRPGNIPYYGATGQVGWIDDYLFDEELVLIGEDGAPFFDKTKPIAYIVDGKCWVNNHAHVLRAKSEVSSNQYVKHFLDWFDFQGYVNGTTRLKLTQGAMNEIPVRLPPLTEQRRIVAQVEALLAKVRTAQERLDKIPTILKRFRQSVLSAACTGKLTSDWREQYPDADARRVVDRLRTEPPEPYLDVFERSSESELPDSWVWVPLGRLGPMSGGGTPSKENPRFWNGEIPWVSPKDMKRDRISDSEDHITAAAVVESSTKCISAGSTLFVTRGMILNHTLPTAITDGIVTLNQDMKALTPEVPEMSEYLFIASKYLARQILFEVKEATHGTRRIETLLLKNWAVPVPPLEEQQEIVRRVSILLLLADRLQVRSEKARAQVDRLTQSVLAKAFRGELVPTEAELARAEGRAYETAEELLNRIGAKQDRMQGACQRRRAARRR